jgi:hypothetical protein
MKIGKYLTYFLRDLFVESVVLVAVVSILSMLFSTNTINGSILLQIVIGALGFNFFKFAFIEKYEQGRKEQLINFFVNTSLGDLMIILWLYLFSTDRQLSPEVALTWIIILIVVKIVVFYMMSKDSLDQVKQLNQKFSEMKKGNAEHRNKS